MPDRQPPGLGDRALPDFIIIGAQKSATTSLLAYMAQHRQVKAGTKKATHFFDINFHKGARWYARHFPRSRPLFSKSEHERTWLTGESCPSYMFLPDVPGRVKDLLPQVKLIAILRNPLSRLVSQYYHEKRKSRAADNFQDYVRASIAMAWPPAGDLHFIRQQASVPRGFYADQLQHWRRYFPAEQLHVTSFEELLAFPQQTMASVFSFLELAPCMVDTSRALNSGRASRKEAIDPKLLAELDALYREKNATLADIAGRQFSWWDDAEPQSSGSPSSI